MAKFGQPQFIIVIRQNDKYMLVKNNNIEWIDNSQDANKYASKYAAKDHLKSLTSVIEGVEYVELK